jgi:SSS family solute:Na+ symporter
LQTLPAVALGLHTRWFHRAGLFAGLFAGLAVGTVMLYQIPQRGGSDGTTVLREHFGGSAWPLANLGLDTEATIYVGLMALVVNLVVSALVTVGARVVRIPAGRDLTRPEDYTAERGDPRVQDLVELVDGDQAVGKRRGEPAGVAAVTGPGRGLPQMGASGPPGVPDQPGRGYGERWDYPRQRGYPPDQNYAQQAPHPQSGRPPTSGHHDERDWRHGDDEQPPRRW